MPLLIIHGVLDLVVPYKHGEDLYQAACEPKELLTLALTGHNDICSTAPSEYLQALKRLLEKSRTPARNCDVEQIYPSAH